MGINKRLLLKFSIEMLIMATQAQLSPPLGNTNSYISFDKHFISHLLQKSSFLRRHQKFDTCNTSVAHYRLMKDLAMQNVNNTDETTFVIVRMRI